MKTLEAYDPTKTKKVRGNTKPHMNRTLRRALLKRSTLKRIAGKAELEDDIRKYKDQRSLVVKFNIQSKKYHFTIVQSERIDNDKEFWKTVIPLFSNKNPMSEKIILIEDGKILLKDEEVAECFNEYFCNNTDSLDIDPFFKEVQEN